ncbi:MAG: hypothetical protein HYZ27_12685, partial [Deltaproteobacteria bacterium]|nr:hypothetical protein [Deltaproteobacteria bacterium]
AQACAGGTTCSGGVCQASCVNQCTAAAKQCASTGAPVVCQQLTSGCTDWVLQSACAAGQVCSGGTCVNSSSCTNQCTAGATRCTAGGQQQTCVTLSSGCTEWSLPVACVSGQTCASTASACAVVRCTAGDKRCSTTQAAVETCDVNGNWVVSSQCPQACSNAQCTATASCQPGTVRCNGTDVESCNAQGTAWLYRETCSATCSAGVCTGTCTAGEKRCNGAVPETCNSGGTAWTAAQSCANGCYLGGCMDQDLIIDGVTTTLEGDLKYSNNVIIRNQGQLRVGPTGRLKLTAKNITVEANTTINANDLGDDTRGEGGARSGTCRSSCGYNYSRSCTVGSAYGVSTSCSSGGSYSCYDCALSWSVSAYDRDDDLSISKGSKFGTAKGGGLVQLIAESVQVNGQITANALNGGGSGGGVLIAANALTGNGVIQASGSAGSP